MRKIILSALGIFLFCVTVANAAQTTDCGNVGANNSCIAGCYFSLSVNVCSLCDAGTYKNTVGSGACSNCTVKPTGAEFLTGTAYLGFTTNTCPWTVTCQSGQYFNPYSENDADSFKCVSCGNGYSGTGTDCTVTGSGNTDDGNCSFEKVCVPNVYTLDLKKAHWIIGKNKTAYAKYEEGFATTNNPTGWSASLPAGALQNESVFKNKFNGYFDKEKCDGTMFFNNQGVFTQSLWPKLIEKANGNKEITLYACWKDVTVEIRYYNSENTYSLVKCDINNVNEQGEVECLKAQSYAGSVGAGKLFLYYECSYTADSGETASCGNIEVGGDIPVVAETVNLKPVFGICPSGSYCSNNIQYNCPVGTTSPENASSVGDCYMVRGEEGTQFCDNNGCFYLPGTGKISYNP